MPSPNPGQFDIVILLLLGPGPQPASRPFSDAFEGERSIYHFSLFPSAPSAVLWRDTESTKCGKGGGGDAMLAASSFLIVRRSGTRRDVNTSIRPGGNVPLKNVKSWEFGCVKMACSLGLAYGGQRIMKHSRLWIVFSAGAAAMFWASGV